MPVAFGLGLAPRPVVRAMQAVTPTAAGTSHELTGLGGRESLLPAGREPVARGAGFAPSTSTLRPEAVPGPAVNEYGDLPTGALPQ
jgi:hypothetical protein